MVQRTLKKVIAQAGRLRDRWEAIPVQRSTHEKTYAPGYGRGTGFPSFAFHSRGDCMPFGSQGFGAMSREMRDGASQPIIETEI